MNEHRVSRRAAPIHLKSGYRWRRGICPQPDTLDDLLTVLSRYLDHPVTAGDLGWDGPQGRARHRGPDPSIAAAAVLIRDTQGEIPMHRRHFLTLLSGAAVTAPATALLLPGAQAMAASEGGARVSANLVANVEATVRQLRALDDAEGSTSGLSWADGIWKHIGQLLTEGNYTEPIGARLQAAYLEMTEMYGWMLFDATQHPQAQRVLQVGLRLAREAHDTLANQQATTNLLASSAYQAIWLGQRSEAETLLQVADSAKPGVLTPSLKAVLADRRMSLAGETADVASMPRLEDAIRAALDGGRHDDEPWWTQWLTHDMVDQQTGRAYLAAGDPDAAEPYLALHPVSEDDYPREGMLRNTELAVARIRMNDIPGSTSAVETARTLAASVGSPRVLERLNLVTGTLARQHADHPAVVALLLRHTDTM